MSALLQVLHVHASCRVSLVCHMQERAALERRLIAQVGQIQAASKAALAKEQAAR